MKILTPVDGSKASVHAVKKAIEIACKYNFSIKIITVANYSLSRRDRRNENLWRQVDGSLITGRPIVTDEDQFSKRLREDAEKLLNEITVECEFGNIAVEKEVLLGEAYEKILETAKNENFDLIVMANRGFSSIKHFFTGSVVQRVISEAPCPVLVIHAEAE